MAAAPAAVAPAKPDHIATVYAAFAKLADAGADAGKEKASYESLLDAVKGDSKVKQLVAQYIPKFMRFFADLSERSLNAQLDLCEDQELAVRVHAIRSLIELCKGSPVHTQRIADVLGQLLVAEDHTELQTVKRTFTGLFEIDPRATFTALLNQIKDGDEQARAKGLEFFKSLWGETKRGGGKPPGGKPKPSDAKDSKDNKAAAPAAGASAAAGGHSAVRLAVDKDAALQTDVAAGIKKLLAAPGALSGEEFKYFLSVLQSMKAVREDPAFPGEIAAIVGKMANLSAAFDPNNAEYINQFVNCLATAQQLNRNKPHKESKAAAAAGATAAAPAVAAPGAGSAPFVEYFFAKILPVLDAVPEKPRLMVLRAVTDLARHSTPERAAQTLVPILEAIKKHVPKAPAVAAAAPAPAAAASASGSAAAPAAAPAAAAVAEAKINYFVVECLMFIFQALAQKAPGLIRTICGVFVPSGQPTDMVSGDTKEKKDDLFTRFGYLSTSAKAYIAQCTTAADNLSKSIKAIPKAPAGSDEAAIKKVVEEKKSLSEKRMAVVLVSRAAANAAELANKFTGKIPVFGTEGVVLSWRQQNKKPNAGGAGKPNPNAPKTKASGNAKGQKRKVGDKPQQQQQKGGQAKSKSPGGRGNNQQKGGQQQQQQQQQQGGGKKGRAAKRAKTGSGAPRDKTPEGKNRGGQQQQQQQGGGRRGNSKGRGGGGGGNGQPQQQQQQGNRARSGSRGKRGGRGGK